MTEFAQHTTVGTDNPFDGDGSTSGTFTVQVEPNVPQLQSELVEALGFEVALATQVPDQITAKNPVVVHVSGAAPLDSEAVAAVLKKHKPKPRVSVSLSGEAEGLAQRLVSGGDLNAKELSAVLRALLTV